MTNILHLVGVFIVGIAIGLFVSKLSNYEGFADQDSCGACGRPTPCGCSNSSCPPVPDLSNYVLKSSIPKQSPVILDCSKCQKPKGECPPCPRPRCPELKCPEPTKCPQCAPCPAMKCPPAVVKCKAEDVSYNSPVRPYMAPLSYTGFGMA